MTPERRLRILVEDATAARSLEQQSHLQYCASRDMYEFRKKEWTRPELASIQAAQDLKNFQEKHPAVKPEILI